MKKEPLKGKTAWFIISNRGEYSLVETEEEAIHDKKYYKDIVGYVGMTANVHILSAVEWLREWELQAPNENEFNGLANQCGKCKKHKPLVFAKYKGCLEVRCKDCLYDEAFEDVVK